MALKIGDVVTVNLRTKRGHCFQGNDNGGSLPSEMLKDGTKCTVTQIRYTDWCSLDKDSEYLYPMALLEPIYNKKLKLLQAIRGLR